MAEEEHVDPQAPGTVTGYTLNTPGEVALVNQSKSLENELGRFISEELAAAPGVDAGMVELARIHLRTGFMWLNRAVFQPESRL